MNARNRYDFTAELKERGFLHGAQIEISWRAISEMAPGGPGERDLHNHIAKQLASALATRFVGFMYRGSGVADFQAASKEGATEYSVLAVVAPLEILSLMFEQVYNQGRRDGQNEQPYPAFWPK